MTIIVEKGVPRSFNQKPPHVRYPWEIMEVGDSFWMPILYYHRAVQASMVRAKKYGETYDHAVISDDGEIGVRFWRVS